MHHREVVCRVRGRQTRHHIWLSATSKRVRNRMAQRLLAKWRGVSIRDILILN